MSNVLVLAPFRNILETVSADAIFIEEWQAIFLLIEPVEFDGSVLGYMRYSTLEELKKSVWILTNIPEHLLVL